MLFQRSICSDTFEWYHCYFRRPLVVIKYCQGYCVSLKQALAVIPFYSKVSILFAIPGASINWINKPFLSQKGNCSHASFSNLLCLCRTGIVVERCDKNNYDTSLFSGMYILKEVYYMTTSIPAIHFFMVVSLFHGSTWVDPYVKDTVFISQHLLQPSIIRSGLWLIRENLKGMIVWWKPLKITVVLLF